MTVLILPLSLALAACAPAAAPGAASGASPDLAADADCLQPADHWRVRATEDDRRRIREWRTAWVEALAKARAAGHGDDIAREGALLDPDAAIPGPLPPSGDYDCRVIKLGGQSPGLLDYVAYPSFRCRIGVEDGQPAFAKLTGSQRPIGRFYPDINRRMVFLGTLQLGDESRAFSYGVDEERDMAGLLERVGEQRWRIAFPYPHFESMLDVIELTPR